MVKYIIKRLLLAILILFGVSIILYVLVRLMPTNYIVSKFSTQMATSGMTVYDLEAIMKTYGFDLKITSETVWEVDDSFKAIFTGYWEWLLNVLQGDFGKSFQTAQPVGEVIFEHMGISFGISFASLVIEMLVAIPLGIKCACNQYGKIDYTVTVLCMIGMAFPSFFLGNLFIKWFAVDLGWFETGGLMSSSLQGANFFEKFGDVAWHLVLPLLVLIILDIGSLMRYTRTNTLEVLNADYIRTARAKGLSEGKVVYKHVFRNTMIPLVTVLAATLPTLFGGAMITESVFDIPGIGQTAYQALTVGDIPVIMGYNMFIAVLTVIGTLLADLMYGVVDPRVKIGK